MMDFLERNKVMVVQVLAGALLALIMDWLSLPVWMIGAAVAAVVAMWTTQMVAAFDKHVVPHLKAAQDRKTED